MSEFTFRFDKKRVGIQFAIVAAIYGVLYIITYAIGDGNFTVAINQLMVSSPPWLQSVLYYYTKYGYDVFFGIVIIIALLAYFTPIEKLIPYRISFLGLVFGYDISWALTSFLFKPVIARPRPFNDPAVKDRISIYTPSSGEPYESGGFSFPSGHATAAFSMSGSLMARVKIWAGRILLYVYAISLSLTRPYFGEHFVTDILAGSILGLTCSLLLWLLFEHLNARGKLSEDKQRLLLVVGIFIVLVSGVLDLLDIV